MVEIQQDSVFCFVVFNSFRGMLFSLWRYRRRYRLIHVVGVDQE
jgi:hypothetical protein